VELGRLEGVEIRTLWEHQAGDSTPWQLDHADPLAETRGIGLDLEQSLAKSGHVAPRIEQSCRPCTARV